MKRGSIAILIILLVAVGAGAVSVWYHYANQRLVRDFWGTGAALLISKAPEVTAMRLGEPGRSISPDEDDAEPPAAKAETASGDEQAEPDESRPVAIEFDQTPWLVVASRDAAAAKGIGNLRRALVLDSTYDWSKPAEQPPRWQYALDMNDGHDWAAVLFDFDSRQVGLAGGRQTAVLNEAAAGEFHSFFDEQFADDANESPAVDASKSDGEKTDAAKASEAKPQ